MRRFLLLVSVPALALMGAGCSLVGSNDAADQSPATAATSVASTSPGPGVVPDVVSDSQRSAANTLRNAGFVVAEEFAPDPDGGEYEAGQVFDQLPAAGTELQPGSIVTVFVVEGTPEAAAPVDGVGQGALVGEPIEPTVALGADAIWPEPLDQAGSEAIAQRFASEVLGWENPSLTAGGGVVIDGEATRFTVRDDTGEGVGLETLPFGDGGWGITDIGEPVGIGSAQQPEVGTRVEIAPVPGVARVIVHIGDQNGETRAWQVDLTNDTEPTAMVIPDLAPSGIATILTLYNDATGQTITAAGQQYGSG